MVKLTQIIKTDNIIKVSPEDTLSSALAKLSSSHDAAFVFDKNNKYLGVINPYHTLIKTSYPGNAKVSHCIFHAPRIYLYYPYAKIAKLMDESKVHYLPVFDKDDNFQGIISARRLFSQLLPTQLFNVAIGDILQTKKGGVITINLNDTISNALHLFKTARVSKLIVVDNNNKLAGILSYYDIISFLMTPKEKIHLGSRDGDKVHFQTQKVKNFMKSYVLTLNMDDMASEALSLILEMKIGSVVIVDEERKPIGILTTRDFMNIISYKVQEQNIEVITKNLSFKSRQIVGGFFNSFAYQLKKLPQYNRAKLFVKEEKGGEIFKAILSLFPQKGAPTILHEEGRDLTNVLHGLKK